MNITITLKHITTILLLTNFSFLYLINHQNIQIQTLSEKLAKMESMLLSLEKSLQEKETKLSSLFDDVSKQKIQQSIDYASSNSSYSHYSDFINVNFCLKLIVVILAISLSVYIYQFICYKIANFSVSALLPSIKIPSFLTPYIAEHKIFTLLMGPYTLKVSFKDNAIKGIDIKHLDSERYMPLDNYLNTRPDNEITDLQDNISNTVTNPDSTTLLITSNNTSNNVADITTNTSSSVTNVAPSPDPSSTIINQNTVDPEAASKVANLFLGL